MELPSELKTLYRHWPRHIVSPRFPQKIDIPEEILSFIQERVKIWQLKTRGEARPFTADPILAKYRFCNILRELDKQTIEFHKLLAPLRADFQLWLLNMFYCRLVARPETIRSVGLLSFDKAQNSKVYDRLMDYERPRFGTPYVFPISVIRKSKTPTRELFLTQYVPGVIGDIAREIQKWQKQSVYAVFKLSSPFLAITSDFSGPKLLLIRLIIFQRKLTYSAVSPWDRELCQHSKT